ncbi:MAG: hypothetical protein RIE86_10535 [Imperialibacter sp.]|uniref:hypothetical protein n=1 Tax=Imperialibacter sp. TaxID=2038411 RepID=UPI0032ED7B8F
MKQVLATLVVTMVGFGISVAQRHQLVFDKEGRIIKNYAFDRHQDNELNYSFMIEGVTPQEAQNYFIIYQWRNDYLYQANNTLKGNSKMPFGLASFDEQGFVEIEKQRKETDDNSRLLSYQLIKVNDVGKELVVNDQKVRSLDKLVTEYHREIDSNNVFKEITSIDVDALKLLQKQASDVEKEITKIKSEKEKNMFEGKSFKNVLDGKALVDKQLEIRNKQRDKLGGEEKECCNGEALDKVTLEILDLTVRSEAWRLELESIAEKISAKIKQLEADKDAIAVKITQTLKEKLKTEYQDLIEPLFQILHQGVLISKDGNTSEVVYDIINKKIFESGKDEYIVARITPDLPQLTTRSELYLHVLNMQPSFLSKNPFFLNFSSHLSNKIEIEGVSNIKGLESLDASMFGEFSSIGKSEILAPKDAKGLDLVDEGEDEKCQVAIEEYSVKWLQKEADKFNNFSEKDSCRIMDLKEAKQHMDNLLEDARDSTKNRQVDQQTIDNLSRRISKIEKEIDFAQHQFVSNKKLASCLQSLAYELLFKNELANIIKSDLSTNANPSFIDYLLKYPTSFEPLKKPSIELTALQLEADSFELKVTEGKIGKETYNLKYTKKTLVTDTLPPVHRLYRFSINTGLAGSQSVSYNYQRVPVPNTVVDRLQESREVNFRVRPLLTLSTYLIKPQDLAVCDKKTFNTLHFDIGLDYLRKNVLDDVYLGLGVEPLRNIHVAAGAKIASVSKVDRAKLDPVSLDTSAAMTSVTQAGFYFSVNLGFNIIPLAINSLLTK